MSEAFDLSTSTKPGARRTVERTPGRTPLIGDYEERRRTFTWDEARQWVDGLPDGCLNIAHEAVDRHAAGGLADQVALRFLDRTLPTQEVTYAELRELTDAFAIALRTMGVRPGERVSTLINRSQALYVTALGTLKNGSVYCPLFPAFGPEPVRQRLALGSVRVLVTDAEAYERKVAPIRDSLTALEFILIVDDPRQTSGAATPVPQGTLSWSETMTAATSVRRRDGFISVPPCPRTRRCCTSPAAPPACPRVPCTSTRRWWLITPPPGLRSTCAPGHLLVHGRPRLGDRHVIRHHRPADLRGDRGDRRGRLRREAVVPHPAGGTDSGLLHRTHRPADADAQGCRPGPRA